MFDKFKQYASGLGDLKKMRDQALAIKRQLEAEEIVVEEEDVRVVISGDQKIKELEIGEESQPVLMEVLNRAIRRSQEAAAKKLQEIGGGLSGLLGR